MNRVSERTHTLCDVTGIRVGHAQNFAAKTGCTVILTENGAVAGVDIRGSAPGTREIATLEPTRLVEKIHGIVLTGGSAFGLAAAEGVMRYLEEKNVGFDTGIARVPIVPAAVIFDLAIGSATVRPDAEMGYQACLNTSSEFCAEGLVGAGTGATIGKIAGPAFAMWGGIGTDSIKLSNGVTVGVLVVVNALGDIIDSKSGKILAGALSPDKKSFLNTLKLLKTKAPSTFGKANTTLGVVATDALLSREAAIKISQMAQDGFARVINPVHTLFDGDMIFTLSTGKIPGNITQIGAVAAELMSRAVIRAVTAGNARNAGGPRNETQTATQ